MNNVASKSRLHVDEMHNNVTKDYTKLVNMLCHTALLPDEWEGKWQSETAGRLATSQQRMMYMSHV
jgi:23S rRNA maturation-related 3'-5' exoribonuclease YhaM